MSHHKKRTPCKMSTDFIFFVLWLWILRAFVMCRWEHLYALHELNLFFYQGFLLYIFTFHKITQWNGKVTLPTVSTTSSCFSITHEAILQLNSGNYWRELTSIYICNKGSNLKPWVSEFKSLITNLYFKNWSF